MSLLLPVLNDLSATPLANDRYIARQRMERLLDVLISAPAHGLGPGLMVSEEYCLLELAKNYRLAEWVSDSDVDRERIGYFLQISTASPYLQGAPEQVQDREGLVEINCGGGSSDALCAAYLLELPLLSFAQPPWDVPILECAGRELVDENIIEINNIALPNIAEPSHFDIHAPWVQERKRNGISTMQETWARRGELFPNLEFCPSVENELLSIGTSDQRFQQVIKKLFLLQDYFSSWTDGYFDPKSLPKCNPASQATLARYKADYEFEMGSGSRIVADWHIYLTPGKGRLYFNADGSRRRGIICHVGDKLPDVSYGRG